MFEMYCGSEKYSLISAYVDVLAEQNLYYIDMNAVLTNI